MNRIMGGRRLRLAHNVLWLTFFAGPTAPAPYGFVFSMLVKQ